MNKQPKITPIFSNVQDVGKNIKGSKKRFTWVFQIDGKMYNFILDASMISGKIKLTCNDKIVAMTEQQPIGSFQHSMSLDDCQITILAQSETFQLRINNKAFSHLLCQQKTQLQFVRNSQACQDFVIDQKITQSTTPSTTGQKKTIKLRIGSMEFNTNKTNPKTLQSQDWSKMMNGQETQFPNYFDAHSSGNTLSEQVDLTKVSMKKKQAQPMTSQSSAANLLQMDTPVFQITPQQFSTMQYLFKTQVMPTQNIPKQSNPTMTQQPTKTQVPTLPGFNFTDFNTMQLMFQTQCGRGGQNKTSNTTTQTKSQQPVEISINLQDFNTMQMMFKTMNLGTPIPPQKFQNNQSAQSLLSSFSSPVTNQTPETKSVSQNQCPLSTLDNLNMNDFNTMQKMFATNNMNPLVLNFDLAPKAESKPLTQPSKVEQTFQQAPNILDFSTMANLFKTMNFTPSTMAKTQSQPQNISALTALDTLQMTNSSPTTSSTSPLQTLGLSNSSNNMNISNINLNDFNTMQMMFKTNGTGLPNCNMFGNEMFGTQSGMQKGGQSSTTPMTQNSSTGDLKQNSAPLMMMNLI